MTRSLENTATGTIDLLESRLKRVEYALSGKNEPDEDLHRATVKGKDHAVCTRLSRLEKELGKLSSESPPIQQLLKFSSNHPDLFHAAGQEGVTTSLSNTELLAIINSCARDYYTAASHLTSINDIPIPSMDTSTALISLHPRLARAELVQESQIKEVENLRMRTALALQRWYEHEVLGGGECWAEWELRILTVEKDVRRNEALQERDAKANEAYDS